MKDKLNTFRTIPFSDIARQYIESNVPQHQPLDYGGLFRTCTARGLDAWRTHLEPALDKQQLESFIKQLPSVRVLPGHAIPWMIASGYAFGSACHALVDGAIKQRDTIGATCGGLMMTLGIYDHLMDHYPDEFGQVGEIVVDDSIDQWVKHQDYQNMEHDPEAALTRGLLDMYRLYFERAHTYMKKDDEAMLELWCDALKTMHYYERESLNRRISLLKPDKEVLFNAEQPSLYLYWVQAISACLGEGVEAAGKVETFARDYGRLTWLVDDISDYQIDLDDDIWTGLSLRLATEANTPDEAEAVVLSMAQECVELIEKTYAALGDMRWQENDPFTLADVLWAYIWVWLGGKYDEQPLSQRHQPQMPESPQVVGQ